MADDTTIRSASTGGGPSTWRKISLPLPHLFPHLTINFRGGSSGGGGSHNRPPSPTAQQHPVALPPPAAKPTKTGRDWKLRRQKTYDSPGCLGAAAGASRPAASGAAPATDTCVTSDAKVVDPDKISPARQSYTWKYKRKIIMFIWGDRFFDLST